ncbi:MAG: hypothetical protein HYX90_10840 [Chloroflexi bacterium]|nr:hypothetical protein [Chloroflexota bacterium]
MGSDAIITCRTGTNIPSDLKGIDRIEYDSYKQLVRQLKSMVLPREIQTTTQTMMLRQHRFKEGDAQNETELVRAAVRRYSAIDLSHKFGSAVIDSDALAGEAWKANLSLTRGHIIFGPYDTLPKPGKYRVLFKIKLSHNSFGEEPALTLDIPGYAYADRHVYPAEFKKPKAYQFFSLDFDYEGKGKLEYRIYNMTLRGTVWVDYIAVVKFSD